MSIVLVTIAAACATAPTATPSPIVESLSLVEPISAPDSPIPAFDTDQFAAINPDPVIRELDPEIDLGFYERERIPRDAIEPIYTPKFVSPEDAPLRSDEIIMGLVVNGDARAYPVGLMRFREMVNDEVGGIPVLVSW